VVLHRLFPVLLLAGCIATESGSPSVAAEAAVPSAATACVQPGAWADGGGRPLDRDRLLDRAAKTPAVLLGERHDSAEQHRWQLQTLTEIFARNPHVAIALEMIPRSKQAVLDRWVQGGMGEAEFLREVDWRTVWGFDPQLYLPILHFARMNRVPLVAINVDQKLVRRTSKEGWAAVPEAEREGVGTAAAPSEAYVEFLSKVMGQHEPGADRESPRFKRFVEAQSVWDRGMAERIAAVHRDTGRTVVTIVGSGHVQNRYGIPHQLADLGIPDPLVLLPWDSDRPCTDLDGKIADAVFGLDAVSEPVGPPKPRLGVLLEPGEGGVRIGKVVGDSVAAAAGLKPGDMVTVAAGQAVRAPGDFTAIVQRSAPGTWLPVTVKRGSRTMDLIAKFPAE